MNEIKFRDLRPEEIEVRVGSMIKDYATKEDKGFQLLLYKTARVDANILDDTVGVYNWQKRFYQVKNTMVCSIGLYNEERKEWIWKDDGGDDDFTTEQVKAELSDSFKRAGFAIGIGRKLYTASKIYMVVDITKTNTPKSHYQVKEIEYDDTSITKLVVINKKTREVVISYGSNEKVSKTSEKAPKKDILAEATKGISDSFLEESAITPETKKVIQDLISRFTTDRWASFKDWLTKTYGTGDIATLTEKQGQEVIKIFKK